MAEAIRVLHFADTHIGMENYGRTDPQTGLSSRVLDFLRQMDRMIAFARENDVDLVIFAGDAFKTRTPNPTYQREFAYRMRDLSELAPTVMLVGNHDIPPAVLKASSIEIYDTLRVPNIRVAADYELITVETRRGPVAVGTAPFPMRARLMQDEQIAGLTIADTDQKLLESLVAILDGLAAQADSLDMPRLLTGHFTVSGASWGSERSIMLGRDIQVPLSSLADPRWDYVALGHIHRHQNLTDGQEGVPPVVYCGSIERIDFGEEGESKGFCWLELTRGEVRWQYIPLNPRPFVTIEMDLRRTADPTGDLLARLDREDLSEAVVRIEVQLSEDTEERFSEGPVRDHLKAAGVSFIAAIRKKVEQTARARLGENPEGLTAEELLERYLVSKDVPLDRREDLMDLARRIFEAGGQE